MRVVVRLLCGLALQPPIRVPKQFASDRGQRHHGEQADEAKARAGHYRRKLPEGYFESLRTGKNKIKNQLIAALWDDLVLATRAPIFAEGRFAAMWRLHSGFHTLVWVDLVK